MQILAMAPTSCSLVISSLAGYLYMGTDPANDKITFGHETPPSKVVNRRDADLVHFWDKFRKSPEGSDRKIEARKQVLEAMFHTESIYGQQYLRSLGNSCLEGPRVLDAVRPAGQHLVDDWTCLKTLVRTFETHSGSLSQYGMKHIRSIASQHKQCRDLKIRLAETSKQACPAFPSTKVSALKSVPRLRPCVQKTY